MKKMEKKPYMPPVSLKEILHYRPEDPATHTRSLITNAILDALIGKHMFESTMIACYLDIPAAHVAHVLEVETGFNFKQVSYLWRTYWFSVYRTREPKTQIEEISRRLGFQSHYGLDKFLRSQNFKKAKKMLEEELGTKIINPFERKEQRMREFKKNMERYLKEERDYMEQQSETNNNTRI